MNITNFGFVWLLVIIIAFLKGRKVLLKVVMLSCLFQAGAIVIIGDSAISPLMVSCMAYIFRSIVDERGVIKTKDSKTFKLYFIFWGELVISSVIASLFFVGKEYMKAVDWVEYATYDGHFSFYGFVVLLIYGVTALLIYGQQELKEDELYKLIQLMVLIVFLVAVWQYLSIMRIIPRNTFIADFIYSNKTTRDNIAYFIDTDPNKRIYSSLLGIRLYSLFMEPSYCGGFLGLTFVYFIGRKKITWKDKVIIILILLMTIMTFSATAYVVVTVGGGLAAFYSGKVTHFFNLLKRGSVLIVIGVASVSYLNLWNTIFRLIINKSQTHSAYIRDLWNKSSMQTCWDTYLVGLGYGNVRGSSLLYTLLGACGVFGTLLFAFFIISLMVENAYVVNSDKYENDENLLKVAVLVVVIGMGVSISLIDYSILWLAIFILYSRSSALSYAKDTYINKYNRFIEMGENEKCIKNLL